MSVPQIVVSLKGVQDPKHIDNEYLEDILVQGLEGEGHVISIHRESDEKAIVTLKSKKVADLLVTKQEIKFGKETLYISKHEQTVVTTEVLSENLPADFKESKLRLSLTTVGLQGKIKAIKRLTDTSAVVSFESVDDAAKVAQAKSLKYQKSQLFTRLYTAEQREATPVYVKGIPSDCDSDMFNTILEELFQTSVAVKDVLLMPENEAAQVTFENAHDSKKLLDLKSSEIEHFNLTLKFSVKPPSDEGPKSKARMTSSSSGEEKIDDSKTTGRTKVLVTNLPKNVDEEYIEMFFENTRLWKGGDVTGVEYNESKKSAVITFQDSSDARKLVEEGTLDMKGEVVTVNWYEDKPRHASDIVDTRTIIVSGLPSDVDEEDIQMYFENRRQNGGPVEKVEHDEESGTAVVCFEESEDAKRMVDNGTMKFKGEEMTIKWYESKLAEDEVDGDDHRRVLVTGLPSNVDEEAIQMFFESKRQDGGPVEDVKYEESEGQAVVTFEESSDAERMVNKSELQMKKSTICIEWYKAIKTQDKRSVVVSGLPPGIHEDFIQMYFESARRNGGPVEEVQYDSADDSAVVTFEDSKVAETIVAKMEMEMKRKTVQVAWHRRKEPTHGLTSSVKKRKAGEMTAEYVLEVTNIPKGLEEDHVRLKVESLVKSDMDSIQEMSYNPSEGRAIIKFVTVNMAKKVLQKHQRKPLSLSGQILEVKLINCRSLGRHALCANSCALEITDLPHCTDGYLMKENLELVFENPQNTGKETIEDMYITADMTRAVITYKTPKVAEYVIGRHTKQPFCIEEQQVHVEIIPALSAIMDSPETKEEKMTFLTNLPESITSQDIRNFVKLCCDQDVSDIIYSQNVGDALIVFSSPPDFSRIFEAFGMKPLNGNMVRPMWVEQSKVLEVYGVCKPKDIAKSKVMLYFESRKAGGGKVESVEIDKEMNCAIVKFENVKDARNVLKIPNHTIQNQTVTVKLHHECIGLLPDWFDSSRPPVDGPKETWVSCGGKNVTLFLLQSTKQKKLLEDHLKSLSAEVEWPNLDELTGATGGTVLLKCTLDEDRPDYRAQASDWQAKVTECIQSHTSGLDEREVPVTQDVAEDVEDFVQKNYGSKTEGLMVKLKREGLKLEILVAGLKAEVKEAVETLKKEMASIERRNLNKLRLKSLEVTSLTAEQLHYLTVTEFDKTVEETYEDCSVNIDPKNGKLTFHGTDEQNEKAKREMGKIIQRLHHRQQTCKNEIIEMFSQEEVVQYAISSLKEAGLTRVGFSVSYETLEVTCNDEEDLEEAVEHLRGCVLDKSLPVGEDAGVILKSGHWRELEKELVQTHGMKLNLMECASSIRIIATRDIATTVYEQIEDFFRSQTVTPMFVPADKSVAKLFDRASVLPGIHDKFPEAALKITVELGGANPGIAVRANSEIRDDVMKEFEAAVSGVVAKLHVIRHPGMPNYFKNEKSGRSLLKTIEKEHNVIIEIEDEVTTSTEDEESSSVPTRRTPIVTVKLNGVDVELVKHDILQQDCDAIMVPVTKELVPMKGTGKRVLDRAGEVVRSELTKQKHRAMRTGQCLTTKTGSLPYEVLIYSVFPVNQDEEAVTKALAEVWKTAGSRNLDSIALPGSIFDQYPSNVAANALSKSVSKIRNIKSIYLVAEDKSTELTLKRIATILSPDSSKTIEYMGFQSPVVHRGALYEAGDTDDTVCTHEGLEVTLVRGEIARQKVDVIVNTANSDFQLNIGAVSYSILQAGGHVIQKECNEIVSQSDFTTDMIVATNGGSLKCRKVYHITLNNWGTGSTEVKQDLLSKVTGCLEKANESRFSTVAFPAIGTGNLGYPKEYVAKLMYESIYKFSKNNPRSSLKQICLVVYHKDEQTIQNFADISREVCLSGYNGLPGVTVAVTRPKIGRKNKPKRKNLLRKHSSSVPDAKRGRRMNLDTHDIQIGPVRIQLTQGDITEERTDAIVNSSDHNLSFDSQLSRAILRAGGNKVRNECTAKGRIKDVAITGAGQLECSNIIHIAAPNIDTEWKERIYAALELANLRSLKSISFPALGTGAMNVEPTIMCDIFMDAIATFVEKQKRPAIGLIRFVIYNDEMCQTFKKEFMKIVDSAKSRGFSYVPKKTADVLAKKRQVVVGSDSEEEARPVIDALVPVILKSVGLKVTAFNKQALECAVGEINRICETECEESEIPVSNVDILSEELTEEIEDLERFHSVSITVDSGAPCVRIKGRGKEVGVVYRKVTDLLREAETVVAIEKEQEQIYEIARWQFYNREEGDYEDYPMDTNYKIECSHKAQLDFVEWTEEDDKTYKIDFRTMQEYPIGDRAKAIDVRKYSPAELDLPSTWEKMGPTTNIAVHKVPTHKREGETVLNMIATDMAHTNYLKKVVSIERIQNKRLYRNYIINRSAVQMANPRVKLFERKLWHGTTINAVEGINASGFNRAHSFSHSSVTNYGKGVYFATEASEAHLYTMGKDKRPPKDNTHIMYLCKVLTGDYTLGKEDMVEPPTKDPTTKKKYDSVVDNVDDPSIFVVFYDAWAYPEYLIRYEGPPKRKIPLMADSDTDDVSQVFIMHDDAADDGEAYIEG